MPEVKKKHAGGRPRKTLADLPVGWQDEVLRMSAEGMAKEEIKLNYFNISKGLYDALCAREPEFLEIIKKADELCQGWWLRQARKNLKAEHFQTGLWTQNMKNRFGWRDKTEIELSGEISFSEKEKNERIERLRKAYLPEFKSPV